MGEIALTDNQGTRCVHIDSVDDSGAQNAVDAGEISMMFRDLYDSLLTPKNAPRPDMYFILADFKSYAAAQERVEDKYRNTSAWARSAILNTAHSGKFTSDRTIQQYVDDIWHLDKITVRK